jgi:hypothetical protein
MISGGSQMVEFAPEIAMTLVFAVATIALIYLLWSR